MPARQGARDGRHRDGWGSGNRAVSVVLTLLGAGCIAWWTGCAASADPPDAGDDIVASEGGQPGSDDTTTDTDSDLGLEEGSNIPPPYEGPGDQTCEVDDSGSCLEEEAGASDFASIYSNILQPSCGGCHGASGGFSLGADQDGAYAALVTETNANASATCAAEIGGPYVVAGNADNSALIMLVETTFGAACGESSRMPPPGQQRLPAAQVAEIRAWIDAGAKP